MLNTTNYIQNGNLMEWDTNVPDMMDTQETATTLLRLQTDFKEEHGARHVWADASGDRADRFTYQGANALRATLTAAAVADDFRIGPEGMSLTAYTGTVTPQILLKSGHNYRFVVAARCNTEGNLLRMRVIFRNNADTVELYTQNTTDGRSVDFSGTDTTPYDFGMNTTWRQYSLGFLCPLGNANDVLENAVWEVSNGTAGAQVIDIGEFRFEDLSVGERGR